MPSKVHRTNNSPADERRNDTDHRWQRKMRSASRKQADDSEHQKGDSNEERNSSAKFIEGVHLHEFSTRPKIKILSDLLPSYSYTIRSLDYTHHIDNNDDAVTIRFRHLLSGRWPALAGWRFPNRPPFQGEHKCGTSALA
jgi:hypothetical protein